MPTESEVTATINADIALLKKSADEITDLKAKNAVLASTASAAQAQITQAGTERDAAIAQATSAQNALTAAQTAATAAAAQATTDKNALLAQIAELQTQLGNTTGTGNASAELVAAAAALDAQAKVNDGLIDDLNTPPPPPPTDDAAIIAELSDNTTSGIDKRLGATAPVGMVLPDVWERPLVPTTDTGYGQPGLLKFSQGLSINYVPPVVDPTVQPPLPVPTPRFDYGSTEVNVLINPDVELQVLPGATKPVAGTEMGIGVVRLRSEEHAQGQVSEGLQVMWNETGGAFPDGTALSQFVPDMKEKLGRVLDIARARTNRYDIGFVLCDRARGGVGYIGTVGTRTAKTWWGNALPVGKIPLSLAISSQNEFALVGVHDEVTGKGQVLIYWMWAGQDLQKKQWGGKSFPFDFPVAHPGLVSSGAITGMKLFAAVDLPIKFPTSISCAFSPGANTRIQGPDGNASYLNVWGLSTDAERAAFLHQNSTWISTWGKAAVASSYEGKVVTIDLTALVAGVRDQYFGSQAKYDETAYQGTGAYDAYSLTDPMKFPWGVEAKPAWAPTIGTVFDVVTPKALLMSENGNAELAVASADGFLRYFKWDGTANGSVHVGDNPVHLNQNKWPNARSGGPIVTCRASRSVVIMSGWGPTATIQTTIQDSALLDPVAAECGDTHGVQMPYYTVCDRNGKKLRNYRTGILKLATQGGATFGMGADEQGTGKDETGKRIPTGTASIESGGSYDLLGKPFDLWGSNVN